MPVVLDQAERLHVDLIVMASHGRTGLPRVIVGSVADALVHRLTCPIVIIPSLAARHIELTTWVEKANTFATR